MPGPDAGSAVVKPASSFSSKTVRPRAPSGTRCMGQKRPRLVEYDSTVNYSNSKKIQVREKMACEHKTERIREKIINDSHVYGNRHYR